MLNVQELSRFWNCNRALRGFMISPIPYFPRIFILIIVPFQFVFQDRFIFLLVILLIWYAAVGLIRICLLFSLSCRRASTNLFSTCFSSKWRHKADVVLYQNEYYYDTIMKPKHQLWILWLLESPFHTGTLEVRSWGR